MSIVYYVLPMLFHENTRKALKYVMFVVGVLIILSMIIWSAPSLFR